MLRTTAWVVSLAVAGMLAGGLGGAWVTADQRAQDTRQEARQFTLRGDAITGESTSALVALESSGAAPCSAADLAQMRSLVMSSVHVKNVGRISPEQTLQCDALHGILNPAQPLPQPAYTSINGHRVRLDVSLPDMPEARVMMVARGSAAVMMPRLIYANVIDPRYDYVIVALNGTQRTEFLRAGPALPLDALPMTSGATYLHEGRPYEAVCTATGCLFASLRNPPALHNSSVFLGLLVAGALVGLGLGLIVDTALARLRAPGRQLRKALRAGALDLVYQPIVRISDGVWVGAEALLRWRDAQGRTISPEVFVAVAEQEGFVDELTRFVVNRVVHELGPKLAARPDFHVSVNVPVSDLLDLGFARFVARTLQAHRLPAASLSFEITERSTAARGAINHGIQRLRQAGHAVYIDDFGVEYSSLSYLSHLQVDGIKLDRGFIAALGDDRTANLVPQIVQMGQVLRVDLIVEGVETTGQADYLVGLDPDILGQGWLFSRPLPADELRL